MKAVKFQSFLHQSIHKILSKTLFMFLNQGKTPSIYPLFPWETVLFGDVCEAVFAFMILVGESGWLLSSILDFLCGDGFALLVSFNLSSSGIELNIASKSGSEWNSSPDTLRFFVSSFFLVHSATIKKIKRVIRNSKNIIHCQL